METIKQLQTPASYEHAVLIVRSQGHLMKLSNKTIIVSVNKKVLLRERKRHTARKRAQDADPPQPAGPDPPPPSRLDLTPPQVWTDKQSETITFLSYYVRGR